MFWKLWPGTDKTHVSHQYIQYLWQFIQFHRRKKGPIRVNRSFSAVVTRLCVRCRQCSIVLNFKIVKLRSCRLTRLCRKKTGPRK